MVRTGSHLVKSLFYARISVAHRTEPELIEQGSNGCRGIQLPKTATMQISMRLTNVTHLKFFDALDLIWIVGNDRVDPLAVTVT